MGTQKNRLNETVLLSTKTYDMLKLMGKKIFSILCSKILFIKTCGFHFMFQFPRTISQFVTTASSIVTWVQVSVCPSVCQHFILNSISLQGGDKTKILMTDGSLIKVQSNAECSPRSSAILLTSIKR